MEITRENIDQIKQLFAEMSSKEDFVSLLNIAKKIIIGDKVKPFKLNQITYYSNPKLAGECYQKFTIKKKSGGERSIHAPSKGLLMIQRCLNLVLQCVFTPHEAAKGFVPGKSIVDNAKVHTGRNFVYNIDLKDFFPSIDQARVWKCLQLEPFNLKLKECEDKEVNTLLNFESKGNIVVLDGLPQFYETAGLFLLYTAKLKDVTIKVDLIKFGESKDHLFSFNYRDRIKYNEVFSQKFTQRYKDAGGTFLEFDRKARLEIANMISALTCTSMEVERKDEHGEWRIVTRNVLPQGAPTLYVVKLKWTNC